MATTVTTACENTVSKTNHLNVRMDNTGFKKKSKGRQHATRSRGTLCGREQLANEKKCDESKVDVYIHLQPEITTKSRANLINWLIDIHNDYSLTNETLYLTINVIDRFLAAEIVCRSELRVVGVTAMFIASKYIEVRGSEDAHEFVKDVLTSTNPAYERRRIGDMEKRILIRLDGRLTVPTLYSFITRVIKSVEKPLETKMENMVYFYTELGMMNYEIISRFDPSMVAAAAIYAACVTLNKDDVWYEMLEKQTGFKGMQVLECARMMAVSHSLANDDEKTKAIYEKYSSSTRDEVAFYPPARYCFYSDSKEDQTCQRLSFEKPDMQETF